MAGQSILARMARGAGWVIAWRLATRLLGLFSMLVLARLLVPEDFGLVALATSFALALDACLSLGVEDQIVRARDPDRALYDTAFTIGLLRGLVVGGMVAALTPAASEFFEEPRLAAVLYALALATVAGGLANIGTVDFRRRLEFHLEFRLMILPRIVSVIATIATAAATRSHWALVLGILLHRAGVIVMGYAMHPYRPRLSLAAWRELLGVSFWTWAIGVLAMVRDRADVVVIGRMMGTTEVGVFAAGSEIATVSTAELGLAVNRAAMSGFAEAGRKADEANETRALLMLVAGLLTVTLPAGLGVALLAGSLVEIALGPAWSAATPVVSVLAMASVVSATGALASSWLRARAPLQLLCAIIAAATLLRVVLLVWFTWWFGLAGAATAVGVGMAVEAVLLFAVVMMRLGMSPALLLAAVARPVACALVMALAVGAATQGWAGAGAMVAIGVPVGVLTYGLAIWLTWLVAGRPDGVEAQVLRMAGRVLRPVRARLGHL